MVQERSEGGETGPSLSVEMTGAVEKKTKTTYTHEESSLLTTKYREYIFGRANAPSFGELRALFKENPDVFRTERSPAAVKTWLHGQKNKSKSKKKKCVNSHLCHLLCTEYYVNISK